MVTVRAVSPIHFGILENKIVKSATLYAFQSSKKFSTLVLATFFLIYPSQEFFMSF